MNLMNMFWFNMCDLRQHVQNLNATEFDNMSFLVFSAKDETLSLAG